MKLIIAFVLPVTAIAIAWIAAVAVRRFRHPKNLPELLGSLPNSRAMRLCPFVEPRNIDPSLNDESLWGEIGRREGIWGIHRECGDLATLATHYRRNYPHIGPEQMSKVKSSASYLRMQCWGAIAEDLVRQYISENIPRVQARAVATLYCDIFDTIEAARAIATFEAETAGPQR